MVRIRPVAIAVADLGFVRHFVKPQVGILPLVRERQFGAQFLIERLGLGNRQPQKLLRDFRLQRGHPGILNRLFQFSLGGANPLLQVLGLRGVLSLAAPDVESRLRDIRFHVFQMVDHRLRIDAGDDLALFDDLSVIGQVNQDQAAAGIGDCSTGAAIFANRPGKIDPAIRLVLAIEPRTALTVRTEVTDRLPRLFARTEQPRRRKRKKHQKETPAIHSFPLDGLGGAGGHHGGLIGRFWRRSPTRNR